MGLFWKLVLTGVQCAIILLISVDKGSKQHKSNNRVDSQYLQVYERIEDIGHTCNGFFLNIIQTIEDKYENQLLYIPILELLNNFKMLFLQLLKCVFMCIFI